MFGKLGKKNKICLDGFQNMENCKIKPTFLEWTSTIPTFLSPFVIQLFSFPKCLENKGTLLAYKWGRKA